MYPGVFSSGPGCVSYGRSESNYSACISVSTRKVEIFPAWVERITGILHAEACFLSSVSGIPN